MIFTLEILQAKHGDCLLLYYGDPGEPKVIVIDGGPAGIYKNVLRPRLTEVKQAISMDKPLDLSMVMVSHLDDDHVNGVLALTAELVDRQENDLPTDFSMSNIWVNTFDDIVGNIQIPHISAIMTASVAASSNVLPLALRADHDNEAVIVSTGQGRKLRDNTDFLACSVNNPFDALEAGKANLVRSDNSATDIEWEELNIKVILPNEERLKNLQAKWDKDLKTAKANGDENIIIASIADPDNSPFNLSSIVCVVECNGRKMLLTGDALGDDILEALDGNNLLDANGQFKVDILKIPHHGSNRNLDAVFFQTIKADHYIISADGKHNNPDQDVLDLIVENVTNGKLYLTNREGDNQLKEKLDGFLERLQDEGNPLQVNFREEGKTIVIDLMEKIFF